MRRSKPPRGTGRSRLDAWAAAAVVTGRSPAAASALRHLCTSSGPPPLCAAGVQCNLCRLHGKVMSMGVASCLQACSGRPPRPPRRTRVHGVYPAPPGRPTLGTVAPLISVQVLLGKDGSGDDPTRLDRVELGCLMATCVKFGNACAVIERFRAADEAAGCPEGPTESPMGPEVAA